MHGLYTSMACAVAILWTVAGACSDSESTALTEGDTNPDAVFVPSDAMDTAGPDDTAGDATADADAGVDAASADGAAGDAHFDADGSEVSADIDAEVADADGGPSVEADADDAADAVTGDADAPDADALSDDLGGKSDGAAQDTALTEDIEDTQDADQDTGPPTLTLLIPQGAAAFFLDGACPAGWEPVDAAEDRLVKGTAPLATVGLTVGAALNPAEDRSHTHTFSATVSIGAISGVAALSGCCNSSPAAAQTVTVAATTSAGTAGVPLVRQRLCERTTEDDPADGHPFPTGAILFFTRATCPAGWALHDDLVDRFIVPTPAGGTPGTLVGAALASGAQPAHAHAVSGTLSVSVQPLAAAGGGNKNPGRHGSFGFSGTTSMDEAGLPYLQLLPCRASAQELPVDGVNVGEVVPTAAVAFFDASVCPAGWSWADELSGRFLAGAENSAAVGDEVGGAALAPGEDRTHIHAGGGTVGLSSTSLAIASGCCFQQAGAAGTHAFTFAASAASSGLPYVSLRACEKD